MADLGPALEAARGLVAEHEAPDPDLGTADHGRSRRASREARAARAEAAAARDRARAAWQAARARAEAVEQAMVGARRRQAELEARRAQLMREFGNRPRPLSSSIGAELAATARQRPTLRGATDAVAAERRRGADAARDEQRAHAAAAGARPVGGRWQRSPSSIARRRRAAVDASRHEEALAALAREREIALEAFEPGPGRRRLRATDGATGDDRPQACPRPTSAEADGVGRRGARSRAATGAAHPGPDRLGQSLRRRGARGALGAGSTS